MIIVLSIPFQKTRKLNTGAKKYHEALGFVNDCKNKNIVASSLVG